MKELWLEAGMPARWPPNMQRNGDCKSMDKDITKAADKINRSRMLSALKERSESNPDTPYQALWERDAWRMTNGTRRQVGLMVTARMDALVMNDTKSMRDAGAPSECSLCGTGYDNLQHMLLNCKHEKSMEWRTELEETLMDSLDDNQLQQLQSSGDHERKMLLLGQQFEERLSASQKLRIDLRMKKFLEDMDDYRTERLGLISMTGRTYTQPPEESMQQAALWDRLWSEDMALRHEQQEEDIDYDKDEIHDEFEDDGQD